MEQPSVDAPGSVVREESVMVNVATPYLRVSFTLTDSDLSIEWPQAIIGLLPGRTRRLELPLTDLRSIRFTHRVMPSRLSLVIAIVTLVFVLNPPRFVGAVAVILSVWLLLVSIIGVVEIVHRRGRSTIPVCLLQKRSVADVIARVRQAGKSDRSRRDDEH